MRTLILTWMTLTLLGCQIREGTVQEDPQMHLPACRVIYLGNCPHVLCYYDRGISMVTQDPSCHPQNAVVSSIPPVAPQKVVP